MNGTLALLIAYLLGSIPTGYLLVRLVKGADVRKEGSGNIGAANVVRTSGWGLGIAVLILDGLKGWLAAWIAGRMTEPSPHMLAWMSGGAVAAMIGHSFPITLQLKGGKSVATFFGGFLAVSPPAVLATAVVYLGGMLITRHSSVGSLMAAATFPLGIWLITHPGPFVVAAACAAAVLIVVRHKENIRRIREGTEPQLRARGAK
jgi:glycerol-3-phosphate acyltransferase PlsY